MLAGFTWSVSESFLCSQQEIISTLYPCHSLVHACVLGPYQGAKGLANGLLFSLCPHGHPSAPSSSFVVPQYTLLALASLLGQSLWPSLLDSALLSSLHPGPSPAQPSLTIFPSHPFWPLLPSIPAQPRCPDPCLDLLSIPLAHSLCLTPLPDHLTTMLLFPTQILLL